MASQVGDHVLCFEEGLEQARQEINCADRRTEVAGAVNKALTIGRTVQSARVAQLDAVEKPLAENGATRFSTGKLLPAR